MTPARPVLRYLGGKFRLAPQIVPWLPPHDIYVEPFGGAAGVLVHKPRSRSEVWNDLDGELVNLFRVLRSADASRLIEALRLTPYARAERDNAYDVADDPVERARRLIVRSHQGHGNNGAPLNNRANGWRVDGVSGSTNVAGEWASLPDALGAWVDRFRGVMIEQRPALDLISRYDDPKVLIYADPPYVPATRSASVRFSTGKCTYAHELTPGDHEALLAALLRTRAMVVLSGYPSPLYEGALTGWRRLELSARAHRNSPRTEVLWINPAASASHGLFAS